MRMHALRSPSKQICRLLIVFALSSWFPSRMVAADKKTRPAQTVHAAAEYQREVYLGTTDFQYPANVANCIYLGASFSSDGFFEGLTLTDTPTGPQFRKQGQLVEAFPDTLLIEATTVLNLVECIDYDLEITKDRRKGRIIVPGVTVESVGPAPIDLGESLRFEVSLVKGLSAEPTEVICTRVREAPFTEAAPKRWHYEILVRTKAPPLTDQVKLTVFSLDGRFLTRMIGGLETPVSRRLYSTKKPKR